MDKLDRARKWRSVSTRDASVDGCFVYAVRTTGIYCRPSCPSRRPHPRSVEFYAGPGAAERAGYRPCKRCLPHQPDQSRELMIEACRYIREHADLRLTLKALARRTGFSPCHFQRLFKKVVGISPRAFQETQRLARFKELTAGNHRIASALLDAGFGSGSRLYERTRRLGMTPARYQRGGTGLEIAYTIFRSPLGQVLLAATGRGICKVAIGDRSPALESQLREEFHAATLTRDDKALRPCAGRILDYLQGRTTLPDLPLDIRATAFQSRVWELLRTVEHGTILTYSDVARLTGNARAVRAAAGAIAANPVALLIPCHRVIGKGAALTGYRWGLNRKRKLLSMERGPIP